MAKDAWSTCAASTPQRSSAPARGGRTQVDGGDVLERPAEVAERRPGPAEDDDVG